ncbi:MAG: hypothetical protein H7328_07305 [Bdellovibrio sp.]|nr:hypothetical protein [Bdellovibrio sp.]
MKTLSIKLSVIAIFLIPLSAHALFEARATYGIQTAKTTATDLCTGSCAAPANAPSLLGLGGFGADVIITPPLFPIGFGVRYENMSISPSVNNFSAEFKATRTAVIVNYRLIDTIIHFGPILTYGISHSGSANVKENGVTRIDFSTSKASSFSAGLELGVKPLIVIPITIGVEAGYLGYKWDDVTNSVDGTTKSLDLSGTYYKIFLGLSI